MFRTPAYYAAQSSDEKDLIMQNATMAFVGGQTDVPLIYYNYNYYYGYSQNIDHGMVASWQNIKCWRPVIDGVVVDTKTIEGNNGPIVVPNYPESLPTSDDKIVILANCALGDHRRYDYDTVTVEGITYTVLHSQAGEYYSKVFYYADNNVFSDPNYSGPSFSGYVEYGKPGPSHPEWDRVFAGNRTYEYGSEEFFNIAVFNDCILGVASELFLTDFVEDAIIDEDHVKVGSSSLLSNIALFDGAKIVSSGKRRVLVVESEVILFDNSSIQWPVDSYPVDASESETPWGWGVQYPYAINLNGNVAVYGIQEVSLRLPPDTLAIFKDESKYTYGRINKAAFTDFSKNLGGLFYENDTPIDFYSHSENLWYCSKICGFHHNATNRGQLLQGGTFHDHSVNLQGDFGQEHSWLSPLYIEGLTIEFQGDSRNHLSQIVGTISFLGSSMVDIEPHRPIGFYNGSSISADRISVGAGELAYAVFTGEADEDWNNPDNWEQRYGGADGSIPNLRTVVRIKSNVTINSGPVVGVDTLLPVGARCRSIMIEDGATVDIPVMVVKGEYYLSDHPQNMGFDLV